MRSALGKLSDGYYIAVWDDGTVAQGANNSGPKLYVHEKFAIKKAGKGGRVFLVTDKTVTQVWPLGGNV